MSLGVRQVRRIIRSAAGGPRPPSKSGTARRATKQRAAAAVSGAAKQAAPKTGRTTQARPDSRFPDAARHAVARGNISANELRSALRVGYSRATALARELEDAGVVGPPGEQQQRPALMDQARVEAMLASSRR
jgi:DNA segregation ATPase FtsK/SpoIIIE-like protein